MISINPGMDPAMAGMVGGGMPTDPNAPLEITLKGSAASVYGYYCGWTYKGLKPASWEGLALSVNGQQIRLPAEMVKQIVHDHVLKRKLVCRRAARKTAVHYYVKEIV